MKKIDDYKSALWAVLEEKRSQPFKWGKNDCVLFAADVVKAVTGTDLAADYRGKYRSSNGAERVMQENGWGSVADIADAHLQRCERPMRGDVVLIENDYGEFLTICIGTECVGPGRCEMTRMDRTFAKLSWRVG